MLDSLIKIRCEPSYTVSRVNYNLNERVEELGISFGSHAVRGTLGISAAKRFGVNVEVTYILISSVLSSFLLRSLCG